MKTKPTRSRKYLVWVKSQPCIECARPGPSDAHHIRGVGYFGGMGMKAADHLAMPLCRVHHMDLHEGRIPLDRQWRWLVHTLDRAAREGALKL